MWSCCLGILTVLLCVGCAMPSQYQNIPPECEGNHVLSTLTMNKLGRADEAACRAAIERQGGPMSIMKSPEQMQQEFGARRPQGQQQDMQSMTPEQYQQSQQMMQQMSPMMQQMQGGMMPQGQRPAGRGMGQPTMTQPGPQQMPQGPPPQMTPQQQEQLQQQMLQQIQQEQQVAPIQPPAPAQPQLNR